MKQNAGGSSVKNIPELTMGPILFHWGAEKKKDFYYRIADESPVATVYLGEVICSKRSPFFEDHYADVAERLVSGGKRVIFSSLAEVMIPRERKMTAGLCEIGDFEVEANDASALYHLRGRPHRIGQYFNAYNEETINYLCDRGATHITLPAELPRSSIEVLANFAYLKGVALEMQVYGRMGLALSARCYHARAHDRVKDNCQFVCEQDPDGLPLKTLGGQDFLSINGVQTLSNTCLNLIHEVRDIVEIGIKALRLSPHDCDMVAVSRNFHDVLEGRLSPEEAEARLGESGLEAPFSDGFYFGREGFSWGHA